MANVAFSAPDCSAVHSQRLPSSVVIRSLRGIVHRTKWSPSLSSVSNQPPLQPKQYEVHRGCISCSRTMQWLKTSFRPHAADFPPTRY